MALSCVEGYQAFIHDRGGVQRLGVLENLGAVSWSRRRDDISIANVNIAAVYCDPQAEIINAIEPKRHELVIYRGQARVWEGPIQRINYTRQGVTFYASDVVSYLKDTAVHGVYVSNADGSTFVTDRITLMIQGELARKEGLTPPVNVLPFLVNHNTTADAHTMAKNVTMQYTLFDHLDDLAQHSGIDYTTIGRAIHIWDTQQDALGQTPVVTENDFLGEMELTAYGAELATRTIVTDAQGNYGYVNSDGSLGPANLNYVDPYYGEVEKVTQAYDPDVDEVAPTVEAMQSQAVSSQKNRYPTPVVVQVGEGAGINPSGVLSIDDLVPGVWIPLRATLLTRRLQQMQKLDRVEVTVAPSGENVAVTMSPAPGNLEIVDGGD